MAAAGAGEDLRHCHQPGQQCMSLPAVKGSWLLFKPLTLLAVIQAASDSPCSDQQVSPLCAEVCIHISALAVLDLTWDKELSVDTHAHTETVEDIAVTGGRAK